MLKLDSINLNKNYFSCFFIQSHAINTQIIRIIL